MQLVIQNSYKSDYKRVLSQNLIGDFELTEIKKIIDLLMSGKPLEAKHNDHPLKHEYKGYRDCHIKPNLILIYKLTPTELYLVRIGRHQDLFKNY